MHASLVPEPAGNLPLDRKELLRGVTRALRCLCRNGFIFSLPSGWLFARQPFALAPAFGRDKFSTPQAALLFSCDGLPRFHPLMVRECPPVAHHFNFQMRFLDETIPANFIALLTKNETSHALIAYHLAEELGRFFATGVERAANQALLV